MKYGEIFLPRRLNVFFAVSGKESGKIFGNSSKQIYDIFFKLLTKTGRRSLFLLRISHPSKSVSSKKQYNLFFF